MVWYGTYPKSHFLKFVHGRKLLQARKDRRIERLVRGNTINLNPRMACGNNIGTWIRLTTIARSAGGPKKLITHITCTIFTNQIVLVQIVKRQLERNRVSSLHRTSCAVKRLVGSRTSIFLTRSFALSEILGQGLAEKSSSPCKTSSNIACSVSSSFNGEE